MTKEEPLKGLRVLDVSTHISASTASSLLADFGAEVIKVEMPKTGDTLRGWPPMKDGNSLYWLVHSRNKKSITLNLNSEKGQEILKDLVKDADVLIENFRPGTLERWDVGYEQLKEVNPGLVMLKVSGFGQTGPYSDRPGFGTIAEALSGVVHIIGFPDGPPILPPFPLADETAGLFGLIAVMFAIYERDVKGSGEGQYIDVSLYEPIFRMLIPNVIQYDQLGEVRGRTGSRFAYGAPRNIYKTKDDEWVALSGTSQPTWERVAKAIGKPGLIEDPRFETNKKRAENVEELDEIIGEWMRNHNSEEIIKTLRSHDAIVELVHDTEKIFENPHYKERDNIVEVEDKDLGNVKMQGIIPKFSKTPGSIESTGPKLGEHNEEIYRDELGLDEEKLSDLEENGII